MAFPTVVVTPGSGQTINTLPNAGQATGANSLPVVAASDDPVVVATGTQADAAWSSGNGSLVAILKGIFGKLGLATPAGSNVIGGVTIADGSDTTQGLKADTAYTGSGSSSVIAALKGIYSLLAGALPAGSNVIGGVTVADGSDATMGAKADAAWTSGSGSVIAVLKGIYGALTSTLAVSFSGALNTVSYYAEASANFNRSSSTSNYAVGNTIASSMTAGLVTPLSFTVARATGLTGWIRRVGVKVNDTAWLNATVRVHFYENSPTSAAGDLAAWSSTESGYKGYVDVILSEQFSDPCVKGFGAPSVGSDIGFVAGGGSQVIYAILSSQSAVASPAAGKTFTVTLETVQN